MNIAIDAFPLAGKTFSGVSNYVFNVFKHLLLNKCGHHYFAYTRNHFHIPESNLLTKRGCISHRSHASSFSNTLWLFTSGVRLMKKDNIDVFWGTRQMLPPSMPGKIKKVLVVYDLVWHHFPETMSKYNRMVLKAFAKRSIDSADHIITISNSTARSLESVLHVPPFKISVIYPAADEYTALAQEDSSAYISNKYAISTRYALTVSTVEPRKNLHTLLKIFSRMKGHGIQLLVAGASGWKTSSLHTLYSELGLSSDEVKFLGYVPGEDMNRLYSGAAVFLFPSIYEGFGIPPLEAMASGTPVICSNTSSLPEVAGNAGIMLEPHDVNEWTNTILKVFSDRNLQEHMRIMGIEQAKMFSWESSARQTLQVFEQVAK